MLKILIFFTRKQHISFVKAILFKNEENEKLEYANIDA